MILPGDRGRQGVDISQLSVQPDMTMEEAVEVANNLGADPAYVGDDYVEIDSEFIRKAIDFRQNDMFYVEEGDERWEGEMYKVVSSHNFMPRGIEVSGVDAEPGEPEYERAPEWDEFAPYEGLWLRWLQGRVAPVKPKTKYIRTDTGEEVLL